MLTPAYRDTASGLSAADVAQRLVEQSSRRSWAHVYHASGGDPRESLPCCVTALMWDMKCAGGVLPRSALLSNDHVELCPHDTSGALLGCAHSRDARFGVVRPRQARLLSVLSSRATSTALQVSCVESAYLYWADHCVRTPNSDARQGTLALQKIILRWALNVFAGSPLLKNITLQTLEMAFPALLAYSPHEREELLKDGAELLGRGAVIWYGGTLVKQFQGRSPSLCFPMLSPTEERGVAVVMWKLCYAQQTVGTRRGELAQALQYLCDTYGVSHIARSPALTRAVLFAASAAAPLHDKPVLLSESMEGLLQSYLPALGLAYGGGMVALSAVLERGYPLPAQELLGHVHTAIRETLGQSAPRVQCDTAFSNAHDKREEAITDFFSENAALRIGTLSLLSLVCGCDETRKGLAALVPDAGEAWRTRLLNCVSRWGASDATGPRGSRAAVDTELRITTKVAAEAVPAPLSGDHALLVVIKHTKKRRRDGVTNITSQSVQQALDGAGVRLKRRDFLHLVDTLALSAGRESQATRATRFLQQQGVAETKIRSFASAFFSER